MVTYVKCILFNETGVSFKTAPRILTFFQLPWVANLHFMWNSLLPKPPKRWHNNSFLGSVACVAYKNLVCPTWFWKKVSNSPFQKSNTDGEGLWSTRVSEHFFAIPKSVRQQVPSHPRKCSRQKRCVQCAEQQKKHKNTCMNVSKTLLWKWNMQKRFHYKKVLKLKWTGGEPRGG